MKNLRNGVLVVVEPALLTLVSYRKQFLPEPIFLSKPLSVALLLLHIGTLVYFCIIWFQSIRAGKTTEGRRLFLFSSSLTADRKSQVGSPPLQLSPMYITSTLLTSNFIGVCFARTIHYQFYSWYFHALPFLLLYHHIPPSSDPTLESPQKSTAPWWMIRAIIILVTIENAYLTFPATPISSAALQLAHLAILIQIRPPNNVLAISSRPINKID